MCTRDADLPGNLKVCMIQIFAFISRIMWKYENFILSDKNIQNGELVFKKFNASEITIYISGPFDTLMPPWPWSALVMVIARGLRHVLGSYSIQRWFFVTKIWKTHKWIFTIDINNKIITIQVPERVHRGVCRCTSNGDRSSADAMMSI